MTPVPGTAHKHRPLTGIAVEAGLLLLAVGTPLALGGVHKVTIVVAALVACVTMAALWLYRRPAGIEVTRFGAILLGVTAYTLLQLVPLPVGLLRVIAPATVEVLEVSLAGFMPSFHPISLDPGATWWEAIKIGTCALAFIAAHNHLGRRERRHRLLVALALGGVVVTFLGFVGAVAAPGKQLMLYSPRAGGSGLITTSFVNPNHGAAFLTVCSIIAIGLSLEARDLQRRAMLVLAAVLLGTGVFMTLSRGGIVGLAVGLFALAALLVLWRRVEDRRQLSTAVVSGVVALILALSAWLAFDAIVAEFQRIRPGLDTDLGKLELWPAGLAMVLDNPWVGVGRGAFMTAFPRYHDGALGTRGTFSHLENQYLHLPAEWGLLVGTAIVAASIVALLAWLRRARPGPQVGAIAAALVALAAHALFDFNLEMLGVAVCVAVIAGSLSGDRKRERRTTAEQRPRDTHRSSRTTRKRRPRWPLVVVTAGTAAVLLLAVAAVVADPPHADEDLARLSALSAQNVPGKSLVEAAKQAVRRHPADPWIPLAAARVLLGRGDPQALAWLNRAMFLFPSNPAMHLEAAEGLRRFGRRRQALLEYRLALEQGASVPHTLKRALPLARDHAEVLSALVDDPQVHAVAVDRLLKARRLDLARKLGERAHGRWPRNEDVGLAYVRMLLAHGKRRAAARAARALAASSEDPRVFRQWARAVAGTKPGAAIRVLEDARRRFPGDLSFEFDLARAYLREKKVEQAMTVGERIMRGATRTATLARGHALLARIHQAAGRTHRARYEREQARKLRGR